MPAIILQLVLPGPVSPTSNPVLACMSVLKENHVPVLNRLLLQLLTALEKECRLINVTYRRSSAPCPCFISSLSGPFLTFDSSLKFLQVFFTDALPSAWNHSSAPPSAYASSSMSQLICSFSPEAFLFPSWVWCFSFACLEAPCLSPIRAFVRVFEFSANCFSHCTVAAWCWGLWSVWLTILSSESA